MAKFRVYEIAKKYNKDNKEILEILKAILNSESAFQDF